MVVMVGQGSASNSRSYCWTCPRKCADNTTYWCYIANFKPITVFGLDVCRRYTGFILVDVLSAYLQGFSLKDFDFLFGIQEQCVCLEGFALQMH